MLIDIINQNAERVLLSAVEQSDQHHMMRGALHFNCSKLGRKPQQEEILLAVRPLLHDNHAAIYFFHDGDLVVTWNGGQKTILDDLCKRLYAHFQLTGNEALHTYYDFNAHGEDLRLMLRNKMKIVPKERPSEGNSHPDGVFSPAFTKDQLDYIKKFGAERRLFASPTILIVEDQAFSRTLLEGMLRKNYICYSASNAEQAVALYAEHPPCITFLDIELPDVNGHTLAAFFKKHDPDGFIVMVTGNNYENDVKQAIKNKVRGFVVKPFSKQKILECIKKYIRERKLNP